MDKGDTTMDRSSQGWKTTALRAYSYLIASKCKDLLPWWQMIILYAKGTKGAINFPRDGQCRGIGTWQARVE